MQRSYSELQRKDDITALALCPYGLGRATDVQGRLSPVAGENGGYNRPKDYARSI
jgi:hypothetical protein